jgi:hypothetical protein
MTRSLAVAIGVSRVKGLPELTGVRSGVDQFETWAKTQGFDVERFDDLQAKPVELAPITAWVRDAIDAADVERLFVYFAGHGVIRGRGEEFWLLSVAGDGIDSEAVNVAKSVSMAFDCGIPHVAFFADACRSPASQALSHVSGGSLFPNRNIAVDVEVDEFYAAQFGNPAYEVVSEAEGLFSRYLLRALRGQEPEVLEAVRGGREPFAVLSRGLKPVLVRNVRLAASRIRRQQRPFCRPGSYWEPNVLAWVHAPDTSVAQPTSPPRWDGMTEDPEQPDWRHYGRDYEGVISSDPSSAPSDQPTAEVDLAATDAAVAAELSAQYQRSEGRAHFETGTGLTVVGAVVDSAMLGGATVQLFEEDEAWHLRGHEGVPEGALLRFAGPGIDEWAGAAVLPGYVGVLTVTPTESETTLAAQSVDHVAYLPQPSMDAKVMGDDLVQIIADVTARMRIGLFEADEVEPAVGEAIEVDLNPSLAVLIASEWARGGQRRKVRELLTSFERAGRSVPFDLPLLAGRPWDDVEVPVVPAFPLLTGAWALLDRLPAGEEAFIEARRRLTPSLWTSFHHLPASLARTLAQPTTASEDMRVRV